MELSESKKSTENKKPKKSLAIRILRVFGIVILLIGTLSFVFSKYTNRITSEVVEKLIELQSQGEYNISYQSIRYDFFNQTLTLTDLEFSYDTLKEDNLSRIKENEGTIFSASIPYLYVNVSNIWTIYFKKELSIDGMKLHEPNLTIKSYSQKKGIGWQQDAGSLYDLISDQLQVFKINYLEVQRGHFFFEKNAGLKRKYNIKDISFIIDNFLLNEDANQNKEKFFYTDDIDIELLNQSLKLKDSIHLLHFKKLLLSTTKSEVLVDSLVITDRQTGVTVDRLKSDVYQIYVPQFRIKDVDFKRAYNEGVLEIGDLEINYPNIRISDRPKEEAQLSDSVKNSIATLALNYFYNIEIANFQLVNANLAYNFRTATRSQNFSLDSFYIKLSNFILDSTSIQDKSRSVYYDQIDFILKDYEFNLPDSIHKLTFNLLEGSTQKEQLKFTNLRIRPREDVEVHKLLLKNKKNKTYDIHFPEAIVRNLYAQDFINTDTLRIELFELDDPDIQITQYKNYENVKSRSTLDINNLYPLVENFITAAYVDKIDLKNGNLIFYEFDQKLQPILTTRNLNIEIGTIALDSNARELNKILSSENFITNAQKTIIELPDKNVMATFDQFSYSTFTKNLDFNNFDLTRQNREAESSENSESIIAESLKVTGFDFNEFLFEKENHIEYIEVNNPLISYTFAKNQGDKKKTKNKAEIDTSLLEIKKFRINNGKVDLKIGENQQVQASNFYFEVYNLSKDSAGFRALDMDDYYLKARDLRYIDENKSNKYQVGAIEYHPSDSLLSLSNILILNKGDGVNSGSVHLKIPETSIRNWQPLDVYSKRELVTDYIHVTDPYISLNLVNSESPDTNTFSLSKFVNKIQASEINVKNGTLKLKKALPNDSVYYSADHINLTIDHIDYDSSQANPQFLFSENVKTELSNSLLTFFNKKDSLSISDIYNSSKNSFLTLEGVKLTKYDSSSNRKIAAIVVDKTYLSELNYDLLHERKIELGNLLLYQPHVSLNLKKQGQDQSNLSEALYLHNIQIDTNLVRSFKIGQVNMNSGFFKFDFEDSAHTRQFHLENLEMNIDRFDLFHPGKDRLLKSDNIRMGFDGFQYQLPDSLNQLKLGRIIVSLADSTLIIRDFSMLPKVSKFEYGEIVGDQTDYLNITSDEIKFKGLSFHKLISRTGLDVNKLELDNLNIYAFRDKRIPRLEEKEKHLPQKYLKDLKFLVDIDSLIVKRANIEYEEFAEEAARPGNVDFRELNATISNICNDPEKIRIDPFCSLTADSKLMSEGNLRLFVQFDLENDDDPFFISASLGKMDLTTFNKMLEPNAFIQVKDGESDKLIMTANANNDVAIGDMTFEYNDLKVSLINKNTYENKGMGPVMGSFFANTFIINKNNPRLLMTKEGEVYFERNKDRSVFNYWAKIFFSGIISSIGAKSNKKEIRKYEKSEGNIVEND